MPYRQTALWQRLAAHVFDRPGDVLTFSRRLARDNGWTPDFAAAAIDEYRRFCYLAMTAGHEVTPSDQVDQVWHLHLLYSRDYWQAFCPQVLGGPLHHEPTRGGNAERTRFADNYRRTLASYERAFGTPPPAELWPDEHSRFAAAPHGRRADKRARAILPLPPPPLRLAAPLAAVAGLLLVAAPSLPPFAGATAATAISLPDALIGGIMLLFVVAVVARLLGFGGGRRGRRDRTTGGSGCSGGGGTGDDGNGNHGGGDSGCSGCGGGD